MTVIFEPILPAIAKFDNNLQVSWGSNNPPIDGNGKGSLFSRTEKWERAHLDLQDPHPTYPLIQQSQQTHVLIQGKCRVTWKWIADDNIQDANVQQFINYLKGSSFKELIYDENYDAFAKSYSIDIEYKYAYSDWDQTPLFYDIPCSGISIEYLSDDVQMLCIMRLSNLKNWTCMQKDLMPNEETNVSTDGTYCYIIGGGWVSINGEEQKHSISVKRLTSENAIYKNISDKPIKILKYYR